MVKENKSINLYKNKLGHLNIGLVSIRYAIRPVSGVDNPQQWALWVDGGGDRTLIFSIHAANVKPISVPLLQFHFGTQDASGPWKCWLVSPNTWFGNPWWFLREVGNEQKEFWALTCPATTQNINFEGFLCLISGL